MSANQEKATVTDIDAARTRAVECVPVEKHGGKARKRSAKYSWIEIAYETGVLSSNKTGGSTDHLKRLIEQRWPELAGRLQERGTEPRLREALQELLIKRDAPRVKSAAVESVEAITHQVPENARDKFNRLLEQARASQLALLRASFYLSVQAEVDKRLPNEAQREIERAHRMIESATRLEHEWRHRSERCVEALRLFLDNWRTLIGCLHPDRAEHLSSVELRERMGKASDIVTRTKELIEKTDYSNW
jgi:hypothetical protein